MSIDAGSIEADVTINSGQAQRDLKKFEGSLKRTGMAAKGLGPALSAIKFKAIVAGAGLAVTSINALGGAVLGLTSQLGPLAGLLATIPQGFGIIATGAAATILGLKGVTDSLGKYAKATTALEKTKAFEGRSEEVKKFSKEVFGLRGQIKSMQNTAADGLLPGLSEGLKSIMSLLGPVKSILFSVGEAVGNIGSKLGKFMGSFDFMKDFRDLSASSTRIMGSFGDSIVSLAKGFTDLAVAAIPLTEWVAKGITGLSKWFESATAAGRATGSLANYFKNTMRVTKMWGSLLGGLFGALNNVMSAAKPLGSWILTSMTAGANQLKRMTGEAGNMAKMTRGFNSFKAPLVSMVKLLKDVGKAFVTLNDPATLTVVLDSLRTKLLPALVDLVKAGQDFGPVLADALAKIARVLAVLTKESGALNVLVQGVGSLAGALADLADKGVPIGELFALFTVAKLAKGVLGLRAMTTGVTLLGASFKATMAWGGGLKAGLGTLVAGFNPLTAAVLAAAAAFMLYKKMMSDAKKGGNEFAKAVMGDFDAATASADELLAKQRQLQREGEAQKKRGQNGSWKPWDVDANREERVGGDVLLGQSKALAEQIAVMREFAGASKLSEAAAQDFIVAQGKLGVVFKTSKEALTAYQNHLASGYKSASDLATNAATDLAAAQKEVAEATKNAAQDAKNAAIEMANANKAIADAQKTVTRSGQDAQDAIEAYAEAKRNAVVDTSNLVAAEKELYAAQADLAVQRRGAGEDLIDLGFAARRAAFAEADAAKQLSELYKDVADQQKELTFVTDDFTGKVYEVMRVTAKEGKSAVDAADQRARAELALEEAVVGNRRAQEALSDAQRKGVDGSDRVVAAHERIKNANKAVTDAIKENTKQAKANEKAVIAAQRNMDDSIATHKTAVEDLAAAKATAADLAIEHLDREKQARAEATDLYINLIRRESEARAAAVRQAVADSAWMASAQGQAQIPWTPGTAPYLGPMHAGGTVTAGRGVPGLDHTERLIRAKVGERVMPRGQANSSSTQGMSPAQMEALVGRLASVIKPDVKIDQTFQEKQDPRAMSRELARRMGS